MKQGFTKYRATIVHLGLVIATSYGMSLGNVTIARASTTNSASVSVQKNPDVAQVNYEGTNEDGKREEIKTGKPKPKSNLILFSN